MRSVPGMNSSTFALKTLLLKLNFRSDAMDFAKAADEVAERYLSEGYQVIVCPSGSQVPCFAKDLHVDLLAIKGDEHVFVQIKENREDLKTDPETAKAADIINAQPGWRFDLVVLNTDSPTEKLAREVGEPSIDAVLQNLDHVERAARAGDGASAFIIAWASLEA